MKMRMCIIIGIILLLVVIIVPAGEPNSERDDATKIGSLTMWFQSLSPRNIRPKHASDILSTSRWFYDIREHI